MASSQIAYAGGDVVVTVNAIDSTGAHVAVTGINASRLSINGSASAVVPSVANPDTGIYVLTWTSLSLSEGDSIVALIDGSVAGTAFSTYGIPVKVLAPQRGTDNASTFNASSDTVVVGTNNDKTGYSLTTAPPTAAQIYAEFTSSSNEDAFKADVSGIAAAVAALNDLSAADVRTAIGLASANLDTQLADIPTVSEFNARTKATADYFDPATDTVANVTTVGTVTNAVETDTASRNASKADVSSLATSADLAVVDGVVDAIKVVTDKLDDTLILDGAVYQFTTNALENAGGTDPASIYTYFTASNRQDTFKADVSSLATSADLTTVDTVVDAIKVVTDKLDDTLILDGAVYQFTTNALENAGGTDPASIYTYFTTSSRQDSFKADVSGLATASSISSLNDFDPLTTTVMVGTNNDKTGYQLSSAGNDAIGSAFLSYAITKGSPGTIERAFWQSLKSSQLSDGEVSGTPTVSAFDTNLTAVSGAYDHLLLLFTSGSLAGEARPIDSYNSINGRITLQEPLTSAPSSSDEFIVVPTHIEPVDEIAAGIWSYSTRTVTSGGSATIENQQAISQLIQNLNDFDPVNDTVQNVANVQTVQDVSGISGSGAVEHTVTVKVGGVPLSGVDVWFTTDAAGSNVVAGTVLTDATGKAKVMLDAGSYYQWVQLAGYNFTNPTSITVS